MKVRYTRQATRHIDSIYRHLAAENESAARDVADAIDGLIQRLADQPGMGRPTATPRVQSVVVPRLPYRVFYRVVGHEVRVFMVRHTSRRPLRHLQ